MGTYKVIQDIEAEDKLLGPLTLRQFIYAVMVIVLGFVAFSLGKVSIVLVIPFLPPMIFFAALAAPLSKDQSTEVWLLSRIRFFLKPRRRIWDQSGIKELVTITAPKKIEKALIKDLSQTEVRSRLEALANTIDSRGWAVKNVNVNLFAQPSYVLGQVDSDRLIDPSLMANEVPAVDIGASEDMLDNQNTRAQALDQMIATSSKTHKKEAVESMRNPKPKASTQPADYWFLNQTPGQPTQPGMATFSKTSVVQPGQSTTQAQQSDTSGPDEQALLDKIHAEKARPNPGNSHLKTLRPIGEQSTEKVAEKKTQNPDISALAGNNDLNIDTISRVANKKPEKHGDDEVVISLR